MNRRNSESLQLASTGHSATWPEAAPDAHADPRQQGQPAGGESVHVLLCTDAPYVQHVAVCLTSLLANNPDRFFDVVIVGRATERLDEGKLRRSLVRFPNHSLLFRQFTPPADQPLPLNPQAHYTVDTYTRLWVGEFFPAEVERVLYLDADIVVVGSITPLWSIDLGGALLGTVDIPGSQRGVMRLGMRAEDGYFNAGVLLIDLKQWRETRALGTILDYIIANPGRVLYDQDALNACFHRSRKRLDYKWNVIGPFFREPAALPLPRAEIEAVRLDAQIIHFNGELKPWSYFCDHPRAAEYEKYLRMTEWRDFVPPDRTPINRLRKGISAVLPSPVKGFLKRIASQVARPR
jgi:lipopolysaccharide biosynthesis glycosyltransferase